ncbi:sulfatase [Brachybacterium sp. MASK1Z-5]|uniref:Sulfatase n=1 Tax=Brachybacterium halotolerans TaxID=2795215 RepID=A0ABS1B8J8_9MICO|nr:sulfatase [Brachybacterium halotolerans]MBK0330964.1 sulfatase [Brachybacterium halotolerans]
MTERRPNILMILTDDHAAHAVGAYGSVVNTTPHLDEIAREGWVMENCFCTNSICTPSRASILTGTHSHVNGVTTLSTPMDPSLPTFVSRLHEEGYRTGIVGKWHLGEGPDHEPQGFDCWEILHDQGEYVDPVFRSPEGDRRRPGYATDIITDLALEWIDQWESERPGDPWCLLVHHKAPHRPWQPDRAHRGLYADPIPVPATFHDDYATRGTAAHRAAMRIADHLTLEDVKEYPPEGLSHEQLGLWKYQRYMQDYLECVASVDDNVGRLLADLRSRGLFEDTLCAYASDQGFFLGDHGWFDKRFMYDESIRMPLLISWPAALERGRRSTRMVTNVDFARTFLAAAGVDPDPGMQGSSFLEALREDLPDDPDPAFYYRYWENDDGIHGALAHYGIRTARYKLIRFYNDGLGLPGTRPSIFPPYWELYDLQEDPEELRNVADDPGYASVRAGLIERLAVEQRAVGDEPYVPAMDADGRPERLSSPIGPQR